jgi:hypothetical protein
MRGLRRYDGSRTHLFETLPIFFLCREVMNTTQMKKQLILFCIALLAWAPLCQADRPYVYYYVATFARNHSLSQAIATAELQKASFQISSPYAAWEHFAFNADTIVLVTNVPLSSSQTYVQVIATSNTDAPAKQWAAQIMDAIKNSKMVPYD